jgi:hypothetical protein
MTAQVSTSAVPEIIDDKSPEWMVRGFGNAPEHTEEQPFYFLTCLRLLLARLWIALNLDRVGSIIWIVFGRRPAKRRRKIFRQADAAPIHYPQSSSSEYARSRGMERYGRGDWGHRRSVPAVAPQWLRQLR